MQTGLSQALHLERMEPDVRDTPSCDFVAVGFL